MILAKKYFCQASKNLKSRLVTLLSLLNFFFVLFFLTYKFDCYLFINYIKN